MGYYSGSGIALRPGVRTVSPRTHEAPRANAIHRMEP
jgi:hypothetical protein